MSSDAAQNKETHLTLRAVDSNNWRDVANLEVMKTQRDFVAEPSYYLALCCYGETWHPLAIYVAERVVGFMMWAVDPADGSCWLGGILIDHNHQGKGYGRASVQAAITMLKEEQGCQDFALSYSPDNAVAKHLYTSLGFKETGEWEGEEIVARLSQDDAAQLAQRAH